MKLITGATGRIGYMLVKELFDRGERVKVLVRKGSNRDILKDFNCEYIEGDILNTTEWDNHLDDIDTVFHLAGNINISNGHKSSTMDTNVHGTQNIADLCLRNGINMVYTSSIHAIAAPKDGSLITESTPLCTETKERRGIYDYSKAYATEYLLNAILRL